MRGVFATRGDRYSPFSACRYVQMVPMRTGLRNQAQIRQFFDDLARNPRALLGQHQHVETLEPFCLLHGVFFSIVKRRNLKVVKARIGGHFAKHVRIIVEDCNFHLRDL